MALDDTFVGINSSEQKSKLTEIPVFIVDNPYDADQIVWLTQQEERADFMIKQRATPYKAERRVYIVEPNAELIEKFKTLTPNEFKVLDLSKIRPFADRNAGLKYIDKVVTLKS